MIERRLLVDVIEKQMERLVYEYETKHKHSFTFIFNLFGGKIKNGLRSKWKVSNKRMYE